MGEKKNLGQRKRTQRQDQETVRRIDTVTGYETCVTTGKNAKQ